MPDSDTTPFPICESERLLLREFTVDDAAVFYELNTDPQVVRYTGDGGLRSAEDARAGLLARPIADYQKYGYGRWACILKSEQRLIGMAGLKYLDDVQDVDLGYRFFPAYWGRGLATEAARLVLDYGFTKLGLEHVLGLVDPANVASVRVLVKLGMRNTGQILYRGAVADRYLITAREYRRAASCGRL